MPPDAMVQIHHPSKISSGDVKAIARWLSKLPRGQRWRVINALEDIVRFLKQIHETMGRMIRKLDEQRTKDGLADIPQEILELARRAGQPERLTEQCDAHERAHAT